MAKLLHLRLGVSDDPAATQPTLVDCLTNLLAQCETLVDSVLEGLSHPGAPQGPHVASALQQPGVRAVVESLKAHAPRLRETFHAELSRLVYEGGGQDEPAPGLLRFDDLQLLGDAELDQSIELARAQQEVARMVDDVLPRLDALMSTLLGWRSVQPGLNPLRAEVFIRALHTSLWEFVPEGPVREALTVPTAGLLGAQLRRIYRELADWLSTSGVEPAVPPGGRRDAATTGASGSPVTRSLAKTLLTLERLRKLLAGDFDEGRGGGAEFLHTVPASMALLQDLKQEEQLVKRLEQERAARSPVAQVDMLAERDNAAALPPLGRQLGEQVVRLMFDNLAQDGRLVQAYKQQLRALEPAVLALASQDSRFFADRQHPARQMLERMTQRSLAFSAESDEGWQRFLASVEAASASLRERPAEADTFQDLMETLQSEWDAQDAAARQRREEAARALVHAEQRNLLAQRLASEYGQAASAADVPEFVADFLRVAWPQAVAESKLSCVDGTDDPQGLHALVPDLLWSVQPGPVQRGRLQRLAQIVPGLIGRLRLGLTGIDYPAELAERFFDRLGAIHASALRDGRDAAARRAAEEAETAPSEFGPSVFDDPAVWLAGREAQEAGYLGPDSVAPSGPDSVSPEERATRPALVIGAWAELMVQGQWQRVQLTWASPHQTLFMFTSPTGAAHSMSRRTLQRLQAAGHVRVVAGRNLVDEALDQVARDALRNSVEGGSGGGETG